MSLLASYIVPHPPLIVPDIGRGEERKISKTIHSYQTIAKEIGKLKPDTIIIISPHDINYRDGFNITKIQSLQGNLNNFGSSIAFTKDVDLDIIQKIEQIEDIPIITHASISPLDHGTMIPLYFIDKYYKEYKLVRLSFSGLSLDKHFNYGRQLGNILSKKDKNYVVVASGDLSHKLKEDGPYGYVKEGPVFDQKVIDIIKNNDLSQMSSIKNQLADKAAECGLRSFVILSGILDKYDYQSKLLSYEGPFGVGYAIASFNIYDSYQQLAKKTVENYIKNHKVIQYKEEDLPEEMIKKKAGVFVSLHIKDELRGCIGTIQSTRDCIAEEIVYNAISASTKDPRFLPINEKELDDLTYHVDVLGQAEKIESKKELDVKRYGVIVRKGHKTGLLLPDLEGVDTVDYQINIALRKAMIDPEDDYQLYRFEVIRH
jgi:AmmeMemoRadiSam system protein A/AmmeMemoRadiSam system protein B